jgi:hypothetical protein
MLSHSDARPSLDECDPRGIRPPGRPVCAVRHAGLCVQMQLPVTSVTIAGRRDEPATPAYALR